MRKINLKKIFAVLSILTCGFAFAETAVVVSVTGKVEVNRRDNWVQLGKDSFVNEGEVISTGFNSEAIIRYQGSVMKLGPLTRITLEKLFSADNRDDVSVYLTTGNIRSTVNHSENKRSNYTVRNQIAVASVRGTEFDMTSTAFMNCFDGAIVAVPAEFVNPKTMLGVENPADGKGKDDEVQEVASSKDGKSNAFTSIADLNPNIGKGILITKEQSMSFDNNTTVMPTGKSSDAENVVKGFTAALSSASEKESVAPAKSSVTVQGISSGATVVAPKSSNLKIKINIEG